MSGHLPPFFIIAEPSEVFLKHFYYKAVSEEVL